jgi:chorismate dehydratase
MRVVRLGELNFINALPLTLPFDTLADLRLEKTTLPPTGLNEAMLAGHLDVSAVSSAFYLRHKDRFRLLDGISISAEIPVESVLLFLPQGFEGLVPSRPLAVPDSSETSIALMQYIIYRHTGFKMKDNLIVYPVGEGADYVEQGTPLLAIGDEALTLKTRFACNGIQTVDLAEAWHREMNMPFVFAVWIAQNQWADTHPELLTSVNKMLVTQKLSFLKSSAIQSRIIATAYKRCPHLPQPLLTHYFTGALSYNLDKPHLAALLRFEEILRWLDNDNQDHFNWDRPELPVELLHR